MRQEIPWLVLSFVCIVLILYGFKQVLNSLGWSRTKKINAIMITTLSVFIWTAILTILSYKGFFADFSKLPPRPAMALFLPLPFVFMFAFSKTGAQVLGSVPPHWLVYMQSFRIAVEILLWVAVLANTIPIQMSFEGRNFDILTGILALPVGYILARKKIYSRQWLILFNTAGLLLLLNILVIAVLSMPTPIRYFENEPANTLVAQFPYILLPGLLVPIAYSMHIFSLRQLFIKRKIQ